MYKTVQVWLDHNCNFTVIDLQNVEPKYVHFINTLSQILETYQQHNKDLKQVVEDQKKLIESQTHFIREYGVNIENIETKVNQTLDKLSQNAEEYQDLNDTVSEIKHEIETNNETLRNLINELCGTRNEKEMNLDNVNKSQTALNIKLREELERKWKPGCPRSAIHRRQ